MQADSGLGPTTLTVGNGFTNNGLIELTSINGAEQPATLSVTSGTLLNATTRIIDVLAGTGGARNLNAQLDNQGTINVGTNLAINAPAADHLNSGTINVTGGNLTLSQSGTTPTFTNTGAIAIASSRVFTASGGAFTHNGGTISGAGTLALTNNTGSFPSAVTVEFLTLTGSTASYQPALSAMSLSLTNSTFTSPSTVTNSPARTLSLTDSTLNAPLDNQGLLQALSGSSVISSAAGAFTTTNTSTLRVQANNALGPTTLTVANGFTNNGLIELTSINGPAQPATLSVTSGTLTNAATRTIDVLAGTGGARTLNAQLNNQGTINLGTNLTINVPGADHLNSGTINVTGGNLTMTQSAQPPLSPIRVRSTLMRPGCSRLGRIRPPWPERSTSIARRCWEPALLTPTS